MANAKAYLPLLMVADLIILPNLATYLRYEYTKFEAGISSWLDMIDKLLF
jgi:hypothetical protein